MAVAHDTKYGVIYHELGHCYIFTNQLELAASSFEKQRVWAMNIMDQVSLSQACAGLGTVKLLQAETCKENEEALSLSEEALRCAELAEELGMATDETCTEQVVAFGLVGDCFNQGLGDYAEAQLHYQYKIAKAAEIGQAFFMVEVPYLPSSFHKTIDTYIMKIYCILGMVGHGRDGYPATLWHNQV